MAQQSFETTRQAPKVPSKFHLADTGIAAELINADTATLTADRSLLGRLLETFEFQELRRLTSWCDLPTEFFHLRNKDGVEVDVVVEKPAGAVARVGVKMSATVRDGDFTGLRKLARATGDRFVRGVVLYDGEISAPSGDRFHAVPICRLWESR